jgi:hypothetical protein
MLLPRETDETFISHNFMIRVKTLILKLYLNF